MSEQIIRAVAVISGFLKGRFTGILVTLKPGFYLIVLFLIGSSSAADLPVTQPQSARATNISTATVNREPNELKGFQISRGFRLEAVAAEPLVNNPGAMAFDENGRLFVIEGGDADRTRGRVRVLEDTEGNGIYSASAVYAKDLVSPTALICYSGGVFVGCEDEIIYLKDTKGDGLADVKRDVFKGFGEVTNGVNGKVVITGMAWGLDNRIHVSTASRGGDVISSSSPRQSLILSEGDFSFDPRNFVLAVESGSAPSGMSFDNRGRKFVAGKRHPIEMVMYESRYGRRNSFYNPPGTLLDIAAGEEPGYFRSISSIVIYRGNAFPPAYLGNAFVADAGADLVHRDKLRPNDMAMIAEPAAEDAGAEFLNSMNHSFQPSQLANAPDGTLYVAGQLREPKSRFGTARINTTVSSGPGQGRIYRVAPINFKRPKSPHLGKASAGELVAMLQHPNGWHRDTAARLLLQRHDKEAVASLILLLYNLNTPPLARLHALHALEGTGMMVPAHVARALNDPDDRVREHAVLLSEKFITKTGGLPDIIFSQFGRLVGDPSPQVRYQLAFTLGELENAGRVQMLADVVRSDPSSRWMQSAVLSSLKRGAAEMFALLTADGKSKETDANFLHQLLFIVGAKNQPDEVTQAISALNAMSEPELAFEMGRSLEDGLQSAGSSLAGADSRGLMKPLYSRATRLALDESVADPLRTEALRLLATTRFADPQWGATLAQEWPLLKAQFRSEAVLALLSRPEWTAALMWGLERGFIPTSDISSTQIKFLLVHPDRTIRQRAVNVLGNGADSRRGEMMSRYLPALQMSGTAGRGRELFLARCAGCHQLHGDGNLNGLDLTEATGSSRGKLLGQILDPEREGSPAHTDNLLITNDGQTFTGFIRRETEKSVTLCQANGVVRVVGRGNIQALESLGISAMPEGLEGGMNQQDMADLLEYLNPVSVTR